MGHTDILSAQSLKRTICKFSLKTLVTFCDWELKAIWNSH